MSSFLYKDAAHLTLDGSRLQLQQVADALSYRNKQAEANARRHRNNRYFLNRHGEEAWREELDRLQALVDVCLLEGDQTLAGFAQRLESMGFVGGTAPEIPDYYERRLAEHPGRDPRYYQKLAADKLIEARHGAVSLPTGSGKSLVIMDLLRRIGLPAVVCAPTDSIAKQLYKEYQHVFGAKRVGFFGDGKKNSKAEIVIGIAASLTRVKEGDAHWDALSKRDVIIFDESHMTPANNFKNICLGFGRNATFRFFFSATQFRNDGADLLLEGITGPVVYEKTFQDCVREGFLAKPNHFGFITESPSRFVGGVEDMMDRHYYENQDLHIKAAQLANRFHRLDDKPVLILVDHVAQFRYILPSLRIRTMFAHGPLDAKSKELVPEEFQKSDNEAIVAAFNDGKIPCLVGTSCVSTGTDLRPTAHLINLQGGRSEIKYLQGRGRGTRLVPGKTEFNYIDLGVRVPGVDDSKNPLMRHFSERCSFAGYPVSIIDLG